MLPGPVKVCSLPVADQEEGCRGPGSQHLSIILFNLLTYKIGIKSYSMGSLRGSKQEGIKGILELEGPQRLQALYRVLTEPRDLALLEEGVDSIRVSGVTATPAGDASGHLLSP